jgi:hypothetical protein
MNEEEKNRVLERINELQFRLWETDCGPCQEVIRDKIDAYWNYYNQLADKKKG